ncbi:MAG: hypothetical protein KatS3mg083_522 [Candidatus Dojkabacteria bacterium]|nr:MAG: hypothetical protein KatS3mg083_522 [Candidatus Dojkabacteria bacterium]
MTVEEMHYYFNIKFNSLHSAQNRVWSVPEIDALLNLAQLEYIKLHLRRFTPLKLSRYLATNLIARVSDAHSLETTQRDIDSLRTIIVNDRNLPFAYNSPDGSEYVFRMPEEDDYLYFISGKAVISNECGSNKASLVVRQHDDGHEGSPFDKSSYEWGEVNIRFFEDGIKCFSDGTFSIDECYINYVRKPRAILFGEGFERYNPDTGTIVTGYELPDGTVINYNQDCELPELAHSDIVDYAVMLASSAISALTYADVYQLFRLKQ